MMALQKEVATLRETNAAKQEIVKCLQEKIATLKETYTSKQEVVERLQKQLQDQKKQMANKIYTVIMVFIIISCIIFIFLRNA